MVYVKHNLRRRNNISSFLIKQRYIFTTKHPSYKIVRLYLYSSYAASSLKKFYCDLSIISL